VAVGLLTAVFGDGARYLRARTVRTLRALGADPIEIATDAEWAIAIERGVRWFVRAGSVPRAVPRALPPSSTGRPVVAVGARLGDRAMDDALFETGGDLSFHQAWRDLPFASALLCERMAARVVDRVARGERPLGGVADALVVRASDLDGELHPALRVAEIVTSLQIGGAERIAHTLACELPRLDVAARLFALGKPTRARLAPAASGVDELELHAAEPDARRRVGRLVAEVLAWGADVAHVHLAGDDVIDALAAVGLPPVVTIHNDVRGWPRGTAALGAQRTRLVVGCAVAVDRALRVAGVRAPIRAVQNGITSQVGARSERASTRGTWGATDDDLVLLLVANPRPQKRFDRIAAIAAQASRSLGRRVRVVHCGAPSRGDEAALEIARALGASLEREGVPLVALGAVTELAPIYEAADVLVSTSDWEGLSLAQIEALERGLPVVATDVGGVGEIANAAPGAIAIVAAGAPPDVFVAAIARAIEAPRTTSLPARFGARAMSRAYARLLREAARAPDVARPPIDVVLLTNNFAVGGAQSSARRLLAELHRRGRRVLAVTIEERPEHRTPGCSALEASGVELVTLPPGLPAQGAVALFFDAIELRGGARAIVFWNAIAEHKLLVADGALGSRVFDVSPGEMYFTSLARLFERDARPDVGCQSALDYGRLLDGVVVKYADERSRAAEVLGRPVHVVRNGVPLAPLRGPRETAPGRFRFGTAVRVHPHKRLDLLLAAFERAVAALAAEGRSVELAILGAADARCEAHLEELRASAAHLPVRWLGFSDDVAAFLSSLDAYVLVAEPAGCPNASLEALAHGLPTIATDVGGMREQLDDGAGILVGRTDVAALAEAMVRVGSEPALRAELSARARARVNERFSVAQMADAYEQLFLGPESSSGAGSTLRAVLPRRPLNRL